MSNANVGSDRQGDGRGKGTVASERTNLSKGQLVQECIHFFSGRVLLACRAESKAKTIIATRTQHEQETGIMETADPWVSTKARGLSRGDYARFQYKDMMKKTWCKMHGKC